MKAKVTESAAVSFLDAAARVDLVVLTAKALLTPVAVAVVVLARVVRAAYRAARWCRYHFATVPRIYRLQLRAMYAAADWMDRHERITGAAVFLMCLAFAVEVFLYAPID